MLAPGASLPPPPRGLRLDAQLLLRLFRALTMTVSSPAASSSGDIHDPTSAAYKKARRKHWKSTKNRPENVDTQWTPFRASEKHYKARFPPPDLSSVLDLASADPSRAAEVARGKWCGGADAVECAEIALRGEEGEGKAYIFPGTPGAPSIMCRMPTCMYLYVLYTLKIIRSGLSPFIRSAQRTAETYPLGLVHSSSASK